MDEFVKKNIAFIRFELYMCTYSLQITLGAIGFWKYSLKYLKWPPLRKSKAILSIMKSSEIVRQKSDSNVSLK